MIDPKHETLSVARQCTLIGLSRSSLYYKQFPGTADDLELKALIDRQFLETPYFGSRKMTAVLRRQGHAVNRKRVRRLMREMGLQVIWQRPNTSKPNPEHRIYPYLLRGMAIDRPNQVWCADVTYIPMPRGFLYLVAVMDWHSRKVLAWRLSNTLHADFCVEALEEALARFGRPDIFNSERQRATGSSAGASPGQPIHLAGLHRGAGGRRRAHQHGRQGPLHGQHLHRTAVAQPQVRGGRVL
jgi:putative transposase